ncbi:hypothetical protein BpHYR1_002395 [Brachionus plicatilis]|uniref:Uncharacterized protein n=1 Tax=Brachionus plicatilis TaxID=10195 RepID=A0A3M7RB39_BRAPC|nr:hypothetical protein BpHYR1_002395 [Brachionus plicatilis]
MFNRPDKKVIFSLDSFKFSRIKYFQCGLECLRTCLSSSLESESDCKFFSLLNIIIFADIFKKLAGKYEILFIFRKSQHSKIVSVGTLNPAYSKIEPYITTDPKILKNSSVYRKCQIKWYLFLSLTPKKNPKTLLNNSEFNLISNQ